jgi:hypothetical protein
MKFSFHYETLFHFIGAPRIDSLLFVDYKKCNGVKFC